MKKWVVRLVQRLSVFTGIIFLVYGLYEVTTGDVFALKTVYIAGDTVAATDLTVFQKKLNVLVLSLATYTSEIIAKNPWVAKVKITKLLPDSLYIDIEMRVPVVLVDGSQRLYIDREGKVLPEITGLPGNYPLLDCPVEAQIGQSISDEPIRQGVQLVFNLASFSDSPPTSLICTDKGEMIIDFPETRVIYTLGQNPESLVASLQLLFKQFRIEGSWPKVVDLRFSKPVLKMTEVTEATTTADIENTQ